MFSSYTLCSTPWPWGMKIRKVKPQNLCHINTQQLQDTMWCFPSKIKWGGVKILLCKTVCKAWEEKEDLPLVLFPGLSVFWRSQSSNGLCLPHILHCWITRAGQAISVTFAESSYASQSKHDLTCISAQGPCVSGCICGPWDLRLTREWQGLWGSKESVWAAERRREANCRIQPEGDLRGIKRD